MTFTEQQITDGIAGLMDRAQNKAAALRSVLSMLNTTLAAVQVPAGAKFLFGAGAPALALGAEGDVYDNTLTGDRYQKQADGTWLFQYRAKGDNGVTPVKGRDYTDGHTPVKGVDYRDGRDGESAYQLWLDQGNVGSVAVFLASLGSATAMPGQDGTIWHLDNYDPAATDGNDGDFWETAVSLTSERRYKKIAGTWRKYYDNTGAAATPTTLAVNLAIGVASVVAGTPVVFTATATGGATPYTYEVTATNTATGSSLVIGATSSGSWTPNAPGIFDIAATVTDAAAASKTSVTRTLTVTAVADQPPVANAGADATITLPTIQVQLMGSGSDPDPGDTVTYQWAQVTGPNTAILATPNLANTTASGLVVGSYQFSLTPTDNHGLAGTRSYVVVHVNAAPVPTLGAPTPSTGPVGSNVTLPGTGLAGATAYTFNGVAGSLSGISANTSTGITLVVPVGSTSGSITVTTSGGTATSASNFTVQASGTVKLATPSGVATGLNTTTIRASAVAVANASSYRLLASDSATAAFSAIGGTLYSPSFSEVGLVAQQQRYYQWQALGDGVNYSDSDVSPVFTGQTLAAGAASRNLVLCFGNSQTQGDTPNQAGDNSYPAQLTTLLPGGWDVLNKGHNGDTFGLLSARVDTSITPFLDFTTYRRIVVVVQEFTNTIGGGFSAVDAYAQDKSLVAQLQALDSRLEVMQLAGYPRYSATVDYTQFNAAMDAVNNRARQDYNSYLHANAFLDIRTSQYFATAQSAQNPAIFFDGTHCTRDGNTVVAHLVHDAVLAGTGVIPATYVLSGSAAPTIGGSSAGLTGTLHGYADANTISGGWSPTGAITYHTVDGSEPFYQISYTKGIQILWPADGNADWEGVQLTIYKDGYTTAPVLVSTAANGQAVYEDYPTDGLSHTVFVQAKNTAGNAGKFNILKNFTLYA